jgi:hypothetical protein
VALGKENGGRCGSSGTISASSTRKW